MTWNNHETVQKKTGLSEFLIQVLPFCPLFSVWANFFMAFFFPSCPSFIISLFDPGIQNWWPVLIPYALLEYFMAMCIWKNAAFLASHLIAYLRTNAIVLERMQMADKRAVKLTSTSDWNDFELYRRIQVLNNRFNSSFAPLVMTGGSFTFILTEVLYGVACIKLYHILPASVFPVFPVVKFITFGVEFSILKMAGDCYVNNISILSSWKQRYVDVSRADKISRAFIQSCPPIRIYIGAITSVSRTSVVMYMNFVFQFTITSLLALQFE